MGSQAAQRKIPSGHWDQYGHMGSGGALKTILLHPEMQPEPVLSEEALSEMLWSSVGRKSSSCSLSQN